MGRSQPAAALLPQQGQDLGVPSLRMPSPLYLHAACFSLLRPVLGTALSPDALGDRHLSCVGHPRSHPTSPLSLPSHPGWTARCQLGWGSPQAQCCWGCRDGQEPCMGGGCLASPCLCVCLSVLPCHSSRPFTLAALSHRP